MQININKAVMADLGDVAELFDHYRVFYKQISDVAAARVFISKKLSGGDSVIFLACDEGGEACGFTQLYPIFSSQSMQPMWVLNDLFVAEPYRKCDVASKLLGSTRSFSHENVAQGLLLCTQVTNSKAQALYKKTVTEKWTTLNGTF